jgi:hypothetical protein
MFGFNRRMAQGDQVLDHWYAAIPHFQLSADVFYSSIEQELAAWRVPGLEIKRVEFSEGGVLSDKRVYLRMLRERLVFDVCAAPFGTSFFFSCRFAELPAKIRWWEILILVAALLFAMKLSMTRIGFFLGPITVLVAAAALAWFFRNAVAFGLRDLDTVLIRVPVIGSFYERYLRADTYYRQDTRLMYLDTVTSIVKRTVEQQTCAKGVKIVRFNEYSPLLSGMYKPRVVRPGADEEPAPPAPAA